jgi:formylglycine-generating enzyme required for sulfatase activity
MRGPRPIDATTRAAAVAALASIVGCREPPPERVPEAAPTPPIATATASPSETVPAATGCPSACASIERCDGATCVPACPPGEVYIPATPAAGFVMGRGFLAGEKARRFGRGHLTDSDRPHRVVLTRPFCMDATEVTVRAYQACVDAGRCQPPKIYEIFANYPKRPDHPVNEVSWDKARAYCEAQSKRLPTEAEWEWAATGGDGHRWPWGDEEPTCEHADFTIGLLVSPGGDSGCHGGGTSPVAAHPRGDKRWPGGVLHDLAGNVWEWCQDTYAPYAEGDAVDPLVESPRVLVHVVRGGGWNRPSFGIQSAFRGAAVHTYEVPGLGFRCVRGR